MEELSVNDGNGLFDSVGLIDSLIVNCNELVQTLTAGKYVLFCSIIVGMVQKLSRLKEGVKSDLESRENQIADLKRFCDELTAKLDEKGVEI